MKTAIQQSIDKIKSLQDSTENFAEKRAFAIAMDVLEDHKKTEKEQMMDALQEFLDITLPDEVCEEYYNETFKPE